MKYVFANAPDKTEHSGAFVGTFKLAELLTLKPFKGKTLEVNKNNEGILKAIMNNNIFNHAQEQRVKK